MCRREEVFVGSRSQVANALVVVARARRRGTCLEIRAHGEQRERRKGSGPLKIFGRFCIRPPAPAFRPSFPASPSPSGPFNSICLHLRPRVRSGCRIMSVWHERALGGPLPIHVARASASARSMFKSGLSSLYGILDLFRCKGRMRTSEQERTFPRSINFHAPKSPAISLPLFNCA